MRLALIIIYVFFISNTGLRAQNAISDDINSLYAKPEISIIDNGRDGELANNPSPSNNYYEKVVSWIKDGYPAWVAKDHNGSIHLLLLIFGLVGLIGIKRNLKRAEELKFHLS